MRSRMVDLPRVLFAAIAIAAASSAACVIGPKQDDPAYGAPSVTDDASVGDTRVENVDDSAATGTQDTSGEKPNDAAADTFPSDTGSPDSSGDALDAASDAASDGGADASDAVEGG